MWPTESPWSLILIAIVGIVISLIQWTHHRHWGALAAIAGCLFLGIAGVVIDNAVTTPREQIEAGIIGITTAFQERKYDEMQSYISESAWDVQLLAAEAFNRIKVIGELRVTDIQIELLAQDQRARSRFRVNGNISELSGMEARLSTMWESKWQQESTGWKMIEIIALDPMSGEQMSYLESYREAARRRYPRGD